MKWIKNAKWGKNNQCTDTPPLQFYLYIDCNTHVRNAEWAFSSSVTTDM